MEERTVILQNVYFGNVLNIIEEFLERIPPPAYVSENQENKKITRYYFYDPEGLDSENQGRILINYSKTMIAKYGIIAGVSPEKEPIVFECFQDGGDNQATLKGYYSTNAESSEWIKPIFDEIWKELLANFSG
jgi:hypothetical protein